MTTQDNTLQDKIWMIASIFFAAFWIAAMYWSDPPQGAAGMIVLMVSGAVAGTLWFLGMRFVMPRLFKLMNIVPRR